MGFVSGDFRKFQGVLMTFQSLRVQVLSVTGSPAGVLREFRSGLGGFKRDFRGTLEAF